MNWDPPKVNSFDTFKDFKRVKQQEEFDSFKTLPKKENQSDNNKTNSNAYNIKTEFYNNNMNVKINRNFNPSQISRNSINTGSNTGSIKAIELFKEKFSQMDEVMGGTKFTTATLGTLNEMLAKNFDFMKNYKNYFPHNNCESLIKWMKILWLGKMKQKKIKI